jgi:hypothetical protein
MLQGTCGFRRAGNFHNLIANRSLMADTAVGSMSIAVRVNAEERSYIHDFANS